MAVVDRWFTLPVTHPMVGDEDTKCPVCKHIFVAHEEIGLLPVQLCAPGKSFDNVVAIPIHRKCYLNEGDE